ncbi:MAG: glycoside hydrolase domain-containing protein [Planctomycetota bacterium]
MRPFCLFLTFCIPVVLQVCSSYGAELGKNILANPDFEEGQEQPTAWNFTWEFTHANDRDRGVKKQEPDWGWDDKTVHSGKRSVRVGVRRTEDDGVWSQDNIPHVKGTKIYLVRAWIRTENLKDTKAAIGCVSLDENGKYLEANYSVIAAEGTHDWKLLTGHYQPHPKTAKFRMRLWLNMSYTGTGTVWFDEVEMIPTDMTELPPVRYTDKKEMPPLSDADKQAGCVIFEKNYLEMVFPNTIPRATEIHDTLKMFAAPGEYEPVMFCIRSLKDLGTVKVKAGEMKSEAGSIPADAVRVSPVKCLVQHGQSRWGEYAEGDMLVPVIVEETDATIVPAETTRQFYVTVKVPQDAKPGIYRGQVEVQPEKGARRNVNIELEVLPIRLLEPEHIYFGMYCRFRGGADLNFTNATYKDMREHGMTTMGLCSSFGGKMEMDGENVKVTFDGSGDLEQAIAAYLRAGFKMPILWLMSADIFAFCYKQAGEDMNSDKFEKCYRQVIEAIVAEGKKKGWPEIIFQPFDEPYEHGKGTVFRKDPQSPPFLSATKRCLQIMKKIPGLRTEEDGANGASQYLEELHPWVDIECYHDGPVLKRGTYDAKAWGEFLERLKREDKEIWFYNIDITGFHPEPLRFGYGFGLYAAKATGMIEWAYMTGYQSDKPNKLYESKLPMAYRYNKTDAEPGGPTTAWEAAREGVDDYKYLHTLLTLARKLKADGKADLAERAEEDVLDRIAKIDFHGCTGAACQGAWTGEKGRLPTGEKFVSGDYKMANGLDFSDYNATRRAIADWIIRLQGQ